MSEQWFVDPSAPHDRWNVNLPAVVGVIFALLVGVVVWVIVSTGGDDQQLVGVPVSAPSTIGASTVGPSTSLTPTVPTSLPPTAPAAPVTTPAPVPPTSPLPMPVTSPPAPPPATASPTAAAPTAAPPTAAPTTVGAAPGSGDLAVPGHQIQRPACSGAAITIIASLIGSEATGAGIEALLDEHADAHYLRTDQTCPSLTQSSGGQPIYVVYLGPFTSDADACRARNSVSGQSYVRRLSSDLTPDHVVDCG